MIAQRGREIASSDTSVGQRGSDNRGYVEVSMRRGSCSASTGDHLTETLRLRFLTVEPENK